MPYRSMPRPVRSIGYIARYEDIIYGEVRVWYRTHRWLWVAMLFAHWWIWFHPLGRVQFKERAP